MKKILFFSAPWCGSCKILKPRINSLEKEGKIQVEHLNSDNNPDLAIKYSIKNIPTLILVEGEEEVSRLTGAKSKDQILEFLIIISMKEILAFYAEWDYPSTKSVLKVFKTLLNKKIINGKMYNIDKDPEQVKNYNIINVPTFIFLKDRVEYCRKTGTISSQEILKIYNE